ncbi:DNA repair protein [Sesamum angolense]|uniref:DNA repair protein n=1 Tax=Sesamum angolense TaxID=2727404 RepID=A0AAE1XAY0_9LAMI|nr:DNA repair protein [Sesamum angolense]
MEKITQRNYTGVLYDRESMSTAVQWTGIIRRCSTEQVYSIDRMRKVCLKVALHVARKYSGTVMYFDSGNSFSPKRIVQFLTQESDPANTEVDEIVQRVMSSIVCYSIFDIFTLLDMLHQLMNNLKSQIGCHVRMLIIDSLSSLIAPVLGGGGAHGHALMVTAGFLLKELAHEHNLSIVVTIALAL